MKSLEPNQHHNYVFMKKSGHGPRAEFSSMTNAVTSTLIGRPINAHTFRSALITSFYENGASQSEMDTLATLMSHDPATARSFYYRPQFTNTALAASNQVCNILLHCQSIAGGVNSNSAQAS
jgi:integrase